MNKSWPKVTNQTLPTMHRNGVGGLHITKVRNILFIGLGGGEGGVAAGWLGVVIGSERRVDGDENWAS